MRKERIKAKMTDLIMNEGQLGWLPTNPRQWTQKDIDLTKASLQNDPDFTEERPVLVVECDGKLLVFAGNLRTTAARALKWEYISAVLYTPENDEDKDTIKRRSILDNGAFGSWDYDMLANEWDDLPLSDWGLPAWAVPTAAVDPESFFEEVNKINAEKLAPQDIKIEVLIPEEEADIEQEVREAVRAALSGYDNVSIR